MSTDQILVILKKYLIQTALFLFLLRYRSIISFLLLYTYFHFQESLLQSKISLPTPLIGRLHYACIAFVPVKPPPAKRLAKCTKRPQITRPIEQ